MSSNLNLKKLCAFCGREFVAHKTTTTCCSHRCSSLLYKQRKREAKTKAHDAMTDFLISEKPIEKIKSKPFLTISETALYLGVSRPTVYSYLRNGELKAKRMGCKFKISREDIDNLFRNPEAFAIVAKEKQPITEFYTTKEVLEKFGISNSWLFKAAKENNFPKITQRGKTLWSKPHIDRFFAKSAPKEEITEWYTAAEIQERYGMTLSAIYNLVSKENIPKKKVGCEARYSKWHFDKAKGVAVDEPDTYTMQEAMAKYSMTRDQLYHYIKTYGISKVKVGRIIKISKQELDNLFAPPKI